MDLVLSCFGGEKKVAHPQKSPTIRTMLILLLSLFCADKSFSEVERTHVLDCLKALNVTESELHYEKKWATDTTFRLECVENLLDDPLSVPDYIDAFSAVLGDRSADFSGTLRYLARQAEMDPGKLAKLKKEIKRQIQREKETPAVFAPLVAAFRVADKYWHQSLEDLSPEELDKILMYAPVMWADESDSLDAVLKGALHREFSVPVDTTAKVTADTVIELSKRIHRRLLSRACFAVILGFEMTLPVLRNTDFQSMKSQEVEGVQGDVLLHATTDFGDFVIGGPGDNTYYSDFTVIIELGGDDVYRSRAGGGIGELGHPFSVVIDLNGSDLYCSQQLFSLGASVLGTGILFDASGNDTYRASHHSLGAGLFGAGVLIDSRGNDIYEGGFFTQGAGCFGIGVLMDHEGNDSYHAQRYAQGMGGTFGCGVLVELDGADLYYCGARYLDAPLWPADYNSMSQGFATGIRPDASGGIGFLLDRAGNDSYNGGVYAQGTGYWYSLGVLVDEQGNDSYDAVEYAQGSGIHLSVGCLVDKEGDDRYFSRAGPAQGEGHDLSVGFLIDKSGNDVYSVSGGQGVGLSNGMGIFIDSDGNDTYMTTETGLGQGGGREARGFPSLGVFLDLGGKDRYAKGNSGEDESSWVQSKYGAGRDLKADTTGDGQGDEKEEETEEKLEGKSIEELFKVACLWEVGAAKKTARKARNLLVQRGEEALDHIFAEHMDTKSGLVVRAIRDISDSLQAKASPRLIRCLRDTNRRVAGNAVWVLGQIEDSSAVDSLVAVLDHPGIKPRLVLRALGEIEDKRVTPDVVPYLQVDEETDRIYACYALQKLKDPRGIIPLIDALTDPYFTVRNGAEKALTDIGDTSLLPLLNSLEKAKKIAKPHIIRAIGVLAHERSDSLGGDIEEVVDKLLKYLDHKNPTIRGFTVEVLERLGGEDVRERLDRCMKDEKDEFVLSRYKTKSKSDKKED